MYSYFEDGETIRVIGEDSILGGETAAACKVEWLELVSHQWGDRLGALIDEADRRAEQ